MSLNPKQIWSHCVSCTIPTEDMKDEVKQFRDKDQAAIMLVKDAYTSYRKKSPAK